LNSFQLFEDESFNKFQTQTKSDAETEAEV